MFAEALEGIRRVQAHRPAARRLHWNRVLLYVWPAVELTREEIEGVARRLAPSTAGLGIEALLVRCRLRERPDRPLRDCVLRLSSSRWRRVRDGGRPTRRPSRSDRSTSTRARSSTAAGAAPSTRTSCSACSRRRNPATTCPRATSSSTTSTPPGSSCPSTGPRAGNEAGVVVGVTRSFTERYPEGITRVTLLGDPTRALGSIAEPECRRIIAALDLAARERRSRWSGSRSRRERRSRWTAAPRTWTGSPRCSAGWSSSPRPVAR